MRQFASERGSGIFELLAVVLITAAFLMFAIPEFGTISQSMDRFNTRNSFLQDLKRAQAETITEGCRGIILITASNYEFGCDYLPYDTATTPAADDTRLNRPLPDGISIQADSQIIINSRGQSVDQAGAFVNVNIQLLDSSTGSPEMFASGTLLGTGLFNYDTY